MPTLLRDLLFTPKCLGCSRIGYAICDKCKMGLKVVRKVDVAEISEVVCLHSYSDWLKDRVIEYKSGKYEIARNLAELLHIGVTSYFPNLSIVPIPTTAIKFEQRGIDTVGNLAVQLSRLDHRIRILRCLTFAKQVSEQVGLSEMQRIKNMQNAFISTQRIFGPVLVLDDVVTTGSTISAAALALKKAGASEVFGLGLCAASKHGLP